MESLSMPYHNRYIRSKSRRSNYFRRKRFNFLFGLLFTDPSLVFGILKHAFDILTFEQGNIWMPNVKQQHRPSVIISLVVARDFLKIIPNLVIVRIVQNNSLVGYPLSVLVSTSDAALVRFLFLGWVMDIVGGGSNEW